VENAFRSQSFTAVGVSMDVSWEALKGPAQAWSRVRPFARSHHIDYPILMANKAMPAAYDLEALPETFLIDKQGRIAAVYVGTVNLSNVEANVRSLLAQSGRPVPPCDVKPVPCSLYPGTQTSPSLTLPPEPQKAPKPMLTLPAAGAPSATSTGQD
jgi:hypothetical protein